MQLSLNPTYRCDFRCSFCYLTEQQLSSRTLLPLDTLDRMLGELPVIEHIDLYGGEIQVLPQAYLNELMDICLSHYDGQINLITNLSRLTPLLEHPRVDVTVSYDFGARPRHEQVLTNLALCPVPVHVLMLASPTLMAMDVDMMVATFNQLQTVRSVEIKPYSSSQANDLGVKFSEFERFVLKWLKYDRLDFQFVNRDLIIESLNGERTAYSDNHIYITPSGKFAVLDFDDQDRELFLELDSFDAYLQWAGNEKVKVQSNEHCSKCPYLGRCLSEHLRQVDSIENSCNGFRNLLDAAQHLVL